VISVQVEILIAGGVDGGGSILVIIIEAEDIRWSRESSCGLRRRWRECIGWG
jgi:hypothetical protein